MTEKSGFLLDGLTPVHLAGDKYVADLVFVHGFMGNAYDTWESDNDAFWPRWIAEDFPGVKVWSFGYESSLIQWLDKNSEIVDVATTALGLLKEKGIGQRPLLFITHSLGGIVVKNMLDIASYSDRSEFAEIAKQTCGVEFIAVPHRGTKIATNWLNLIKLIYATHARLDEIKWDDGNLRQLHNRFREYKEGKYPRFFVRSLYETEMLRIGPRRIQIEIPVKVVDRVSADPEFLEFVAQEIREDHITICKPPRRSHRTYKLSFGFVRASLDCVDLGPAFADSHLSVDDRNVLVKHLMGSQLTTAKLESCPNNDRKPCSLRANSAFLVSELGHTLAAIRETQQFLDHCRQLHGIASRIASCVGVVSAEEKLAKAVKDLWMELKALAAFIEHLPATIYPIDDGDHQSDGRMHKFYSKRVLYLSDPRGENKALEPLLLDLMEVYEGLLKMEDEKRRWPDRVEAVVTDDKYLTPIESFSRYGDDVIRRLKGLTDTRCSGTCSALELGFATTDVNTLHKSFIISVKELPHHAHEEIPCRWKESKNT